MYERWLFVCILIFLQQVNSLREIISTRNPVIVADTSSVGIDLAQSHQSIEFAEPQRRRYHVASVYCIDLFHEADFQEKWMVVADESTGDVEKQFDMHTFGKLWALV